MLLLGLLPFAVFVFTLFAFAGIVIEKFESIIYVSDFEIFLKNLLVIFFIVLQVLFEIFSLYLVSYSLYIKLSNREYLVVKSTVVSLKTTSFLGIPTGHYLTFPEEQLEAKVNRKLMQKTKPGDKFYLIILKHPDEIIKLYSTEDYICSQEIEVSTIAGKSPAAGDRAAE